MASSQNVRYRSSPGQSQSTDALGWASGTGQRGLIPTASCLLGGELHPATQADWSTIPNSVRPMAVRVAFFPILHVPNGSIAFATSPQARRNRFLRSEEHTSELQS